MHLAERERVIMEALLPTGFVSYRDLEILLDASPATIRRDLARLENAKRIARIHGGAKLPGNRPGAATLTGTPFAQSVELNMKAKTAIGKAAAAMCKHGEGIMIDGGSTTFQMCGHLDGLGLQILTNSLHIVNALLPQSDTRILVPSGAVFREQNIILAPAGEDSMPQFYAPKLFMGAASVGPHGVTQGDAVLVASQRRLIERAEQVILMVDSTKFAASSGAIVCGLSDIDVLVTDAAIYDGMRDALEAAGVRLVIAD